MSIPGRLVLQHRNANKIKIKATLSNKIKYCSLSHINYPNYIKKVTICPP
jgi:hypothetical protein